LNLNYQLVASDKQLEACCQKAMLADYVTLDTEFVRTRTYYPKLGLIQLYDGDVISLIDPLTIYNWQPFRELLTAPQVTKLLHACNEDLEVFMHEFSLLPEPLVDTQVLAVFCGYSLSCGYATLVADKLRIPLNKSETRTDWLARPLTENQCRYAAEDVYYLLPLAKIILTETAQKGWLEAALDECKLLAAKHQAPSQSATAYFNITNAWRLNPRQLAALQKLADWRLTHARQKDMAINFVVKEANLWNVAQALPDSLAQLAQLGLTSTEIRFHGATMLKLVEQAKQIPTEALPKSIERLVDHKSYKTVFNSLKEQLRLIANQYQLNEALLTSRRQINQLLKWHWQIKDDIEEPVLLSGWRGELTKSTLLPLLAELA